MIDGVNDGKTLILVAGLGEFGTCVVRDIKDRFDFLKSKCEQSTVGSFYFGNETCEVFAVECSPAAEPQNVLILIGSPKEINYRVLHSAAITIFGNPEGIRVAFLEEPEGEILKKSESEYQLDQIFGCTESNAPGMIRNFILGLSGGAFQEDIRSTPVLIASREDFCSLEGYPDHLGSLVERTCEDILPKADPFKKYRAYIFVDLLTDLDCIDLIETKFKEELENRESGHLNIAWDRPRITRPYEYCDYFCADITLMLFEEENVFFVGNAVAD